VSAFHRLLQAHLPPRGRVLEIGCGTGRDAAFLAAHGFRVVATDASAAMLDTFRASPARRPRTVSAVTNSAGPPSSCASTPPPPPGRALIWTKPPRRRRSWERWSGSAVPFSACAETGIMIGIAIGIGIEYEYDPVV
jgi:SAM-dependent methyltransferase